MITLPANFEADIQGQNLNLYPVVSIEASEPNLSLEVDSGNTLYSIMYEDNESSDDWFTHTGVSSDFLIGEYVKIDDEYMKIKAVGTDNFGFAYAVIRDEDRGLFESPRMQHEAGAVIYRIPLLTRDISTKDVTLSDTHYKPLLLNIPSIKESMDFENRNYKISNVTLKVSNYEYEGERFSDYVGNLINTSVTISWVSQSESMLEVYRGFIRRYSHDDKTVTLQLEDSTQKDLHKDVPVARLGDGLEIPSGYKLKPVPMVYGYVDRSPCVIYRDEISDTDLNGDIILLADNTVAIDGIDMDLSGFTTSDYLHIFEDGYYYDVLETTTKNIEYGDLLYVGKTQYTQTNEAIHIESYFAGNLDLNTVADNLLQCRYLRKANSFFLKGEDFNEWGKIYTINLYPTSDFDIYANNQFVGNIVDANHTWEKVSDGDEGTSMAIGADNFSGYLYGTNNANSWIQFITFEFGFETPNFNTDSGVYTDICLKSRVQFGDWTPVGDFTTVVSSHFWYPKADGTGNDFNFYSPSVAYGSQNISHGTAYNYNSIVSPPSEEGGTAWSDSGDAIAATTVIYNNFSDITKISFVTDFHISLLFPRMGWEFIRTDFYELFLRCYFDVTDIRKKDFYVNVNGRTHTSYE